MGPETQKQHHHILPTKVALGIGGALLGLTAITVGVAHIDLGKFNFFIAMLVATVKAFLVAMFFMGLKYDRRENGVIFVTSLLFLAIFIVLTSTDLFFRGDVYVKGPLFATNSSQSKLKKPWLGTPELVKKGKELFSVQCTSCHGVNGEGDGPAASALNPRPRNFHSIDGWKNGRRATMIFKTLKEGIPGSAMAAYSTLPADDRWALAHFVLSLHPEAPKEDTAADFVKIGINPAQEGGGEAAVPTISIAMAMKRMASAADEQTHLYHPEFDRVSELKLNGALESRGARLYQESCVRCHGAQGQGQIKVQSLGVHPVAFVTIQSFQNQSESLKSEEAFSKKVVQGLPGSLMPGRGDLGTSDLHDLYQFVRSLAGR